MSKKTQIYCDQWKHPRNKLADLTVVNGTYRIKMLWSIKVRHSSQRVSTQGKFQLSLLKQQHNLSMFILVHSEIVCCVTGADFNFTVS